MYPTVSNNKEVQAHYEECRKNGCTDSFARMLSARKGPGLKTDTTFNIGRISFQNDQFGKSKLSQQVGKWYRDEARKAGVSTDGKYYLSGIASRPGDPEAWVSSADEVKRKCNKHGWNCTGDVNVTQPLPDGFLPGAAEAHLEREAKHELMQGLHVAANAEG